MSHEVHDTLTIDGLFKNNSNPRHPDAEFQRFFTLHKGINNAAGFRVVAKKSAAKRSGRKRPADLAFVVLVTTFAESEWPDSLDLETGHLVYYGDNRHPGTATSKTSIGGNAILDDVYELLHAGQREVVPPFLIFENSKVAGRSQMRFLGLAAPGAEGLSVSDDLVSVWRIKGRSRFTNKKARFTVLREERIDRKWLIDLVEGVAGAHSEHCPPTWRRWVRTGFYEPLVAVRPRVPRPKKDQLPADPLEREILRTLFEELSDREFEFAAAELVRLMDERFIELEVTPRSRDGGRDVVGRYRVGHESHQVWLSVCVEAKKWQLTSAVGVKPMSRLISRLRNRDLGVFITTSFFDPQVQGELIEDNHPVLLVSGGDIARLLAAKGIATESLRKWIESVRERMVEADRPPTAAEQQLEMIEPQLRMLRVAEGRSTKYGVDDGK